jgi:hypothetical protein
MNARDRLRRLHFEFVDVCGAALADKARKGVAVIRGITRFDERFGDVRTAQRTIARLGHHVRHLDVHALFGQLLHDALAAPLARATKIAQQRLQRRVGSVDAVAEHVQVLAVELAAELDTRHHFHMGGHGRGRKLRETFHRIVVGERDAGQAFRLRHVDQLGRCTDTVRVGRMHVHVDAFVFC